MYDVTDFQTEVIARSHEVPVLVDFWAPWCQPCVILGPTLERLAAQAEGRWQLAKVNVDENQGLSQQFGVRGIPAVKLFIDGKVVADFTGALPESQIRAFLQQHLPPSETEQLLAQALEAWDSGDPQLAHERLVAYLQAGPRTDTSRVLEARLTLFREPKRAGDLVSDILADSKLALEADAIRHLSGLLQHLPTSDTLPEEPARAHYSRALEHLKAQEVSQSLEALIDALMLSPNYRDGAARKHGVALFGYLGAQHPLTREYRRRFDMSLS